MKRGQVFAQARQRRGGRRVRVHNGMNLGPVLQDIAMKMPFTRWPAGTCHGAIKLHLLQT